MTLCISCKGNTKIQIIFKNLIIINMHLIDFYNNLQPTFAEDLKKNLKIYK